MYEFSSLYSSVLKVSVLSGLWNPVNPSQASKRFKTVYFLYSVVSVLPVLYTSVSNSMAVVTGDADTTRMIAVNFGTPVILYDLLNVLLRNDRMYSLVSGLDAIVKTFTEDELLFKAGSKSNVFYSAAKVNSFFKYFLVPYMACSVLTIVYCWTCHFIYQSADLIYAVPYDVLSFPFSYELTLFAQSLSAIYSSSKYIAAEGLYFCILFHLNLCLKQLRTSSKFIFLQTGKHGIYENTVHKSQLYPEEMYYLENRLNKLRFKTWIKAHNEIIRYVRNFLNTYFSYLICC